MSLRSSLQVGGETRVLSRVPLKLQPHFVSEGVQQQHGLPPGRVDLIPFHGNAGEAAKPEVIYRAELPAVPAIRGIINRRQGRGQPAARQPNGGRLGRRPANRARRGVREPCLESA